MKHTSKIFLIILALFALLGVSFSAVSTYDFIAHLDRQVHAISCSYIPGAGTPDTTGSSGCFAVMMSPYSSVMRDATWGGIPIALPSLAVFAYLFFMAIFLLIKKEGQKLENAYMIAATLLPVIVSIIYWTISVKYVGTVCKLCFGIYISSFGSFIAAIVATLTAPKEAGQPSVTKIPIVHYLIYFIEGVAFVFIPMFLYMAMKPDYTNAMAQCGNLMKTEDKYNVRVKLNNAKNGVPAIELFDPLCPACKAFSDRLEGSELMARLDLEGVLFPLDKDCNWMITESLHPGACAVSEAILCAGDQLPEVLKWAFENNEELRDLAAKDSPAVYSRIKQQFPKLAGCVGQPEVKAKINKSLRWIVSNSLPIVTPQVFVQGKKLCDEDTDLGLEFALKRLIDEASGTKDGAQKTKPEEKK